MTSKKPSTPPAEPPAIALQPCALETLQWEVQQVQLAVARRAYELFETRNQEHGHDWEDWFQAESELLRPTCVVVSGSDGRISLRVNVLGFEADELQVAIEPRRITVCGRKKLRSAEERGELTNTDFYPDQLLRTIDVETEIDPEAAIVELQSGILKFELPKIAAPAPVPAAAA